MTNTRGQEGEETLADDNGSSLNIKVFPNPASSEFQLEIFAPSDGEMLYVVYNSLGKVVTTNTLNLIPGYNTQTVEVENWPTGVYFIHSRYQNQQYVYRIMLSRD